MGEWKRTGMQTNLAARALRTGRTQNLAVVIQSFHHFGDFNRLIIDGVWERAAANNYTISITTMGCQNSLDIFHRMMLSKQFDGFFIMQDPVPEILYSDESIPDKTPTVFINTHPLYEKANCVLIDSVNGVKNAVKHLISVHSHKRILWVYRHKVSQIMEDRYKGYCQAMAEAGIELDERLVFSIRPSAVDFETQGIYAAEYIATHPELKIDAVVCCADEVAFGVINGLHRRNFKVPEQIAVVGFDDMHLAKYFMPALTTVACDGLYMGRVAMDMMLQLLNQKDPKTYLQGLRNTIATDVIFRQSCGCSLI
jgi:DNA-binding LacI/PurR family transcriptional regulator